MKFRNILILAFGMSTSALALAQANAQDGQWRGLAGLAGSFASGNTDSRSLALNSDLARKTASDKTSVGAYINYGKSNGTTSANKWGLNGQYDYDLNAQTFGFVGLGLSGDKVSDLSLRTNVGAGLGYHVVATPATVFDVHGGLGYSTDKYSHTESIGGKTANQFSRAELVLGEESSHKLSEAVQFKQKLNVFPGMSGDKALRTEFTAGLGVAMSKDLNLSVNLNQTTNSKPPVGLKKSDTSLLLGVTMKLGN